MNQQISDHDADLKALAALPVAFGRFELIVEQLERQQRDDVQRLQDNARETRQLIEALHKRLDEDGKERKVRQEARDKETRGNRLILYAAVIGAGAAILAATISAAAVLFS